MIIVPVLTGEIWMVGGIAVGGTAVDNGIGVSKGNGSVDMGVDV